MTDAYPMTAARADLANLVRLATAGVGAHKAPRQITIARLGRVE
jgi:hypothetical protein